MKFGEDFWYGFFKSITDTIGSLVLYYLLTRLSIISSPFFDIWWFAGIFSTISILDNIVSGQFLDKKDVQKGYYHTIEAAERITGMFIGAISIWILLSGFNGIDIIDALSTVLVSSIFLIIGIFCRMMMSNKIKL